MTPTEIFNYALSQWNAEGDLFFPESEMLSHVYAAQMALAKKSNCIKEVFTASTVIDQQEYARPTNAIKIKRIDYDGVKLTKLTDVQADYNGLTSSTTTVSGTPTGYWEWGTSFFLSPKPAAVATLKIYCFNQPQVVTSASTMEAPERYHTQIADYCLWRIALKDKNFQAASEFKALWEMHVKEAADFERKALRGDAFTAIFDPSIGSY